MQPPGAILGRWTWSQMPSVRRMSGHRRRPLSATISLGEVTIAAGNYQDFNVYARGGRVVSVSVSIRDTTVDIDFVAYAPDSSVVANAGRVKTTNVQFRAPTDGVYTVRLDNTYSYFTSKTVSMQWCAG